MNLQLLSLLFCTQTRGRTGMEVNPLVFETSASTDSAIWARLRTLCFSIAMQRYYIFFNLQYPQLFFLEKRCFFFFYLSFTIK